MNGTLAVNVILCARCQQDHRDLPFQPLLRPMVVGPVTLTHWSICPVQREPILMQTKDQPA